MVVASGFALFGDEILDRLIVEQRIDGLNVGVGVAVVHPAADIDAPLGRLIGECAIKGDDGHNDDDVAPIELIEQHAEDQRQLDDCRHELHDHHAYDRLDGVAPAFQHPRQAAGFALEMEAERELVHVLEGAIGEPAYRVHGDLGEDAVAHLGEHRHQDARATVSNSHCDRSRERPEEPGGGRYGRASLPGQRIGCPFEGEGNRDGGELGREQQYYRRGNAKLEIAAIRWPNVRP